MCAMGKALEKLRDAAWRAYWPVEKALVPGMQGAQDVYAEVMVQALTGVEHWLDIGCGWHTFPTWRGQAEREAVGRVRRVVGVDVDLPPGPGQASNHPYPGGSEHHQSPVLRRLPST